MGIAISQKIKPHVHFWNNQDSLKIKVLNPLSSSSNLNFLMEFCTSANGISIHSVASLRTLKVILDLCPLFSMSNWSSDLSVLSEECPLAKVLFYHPHGHWLRPSSFLFGVLIQPSIRFPWHLSSSPQVHSSHRQQNDLPENNSHQVTFLLKDLSRSPVVHRMNSNLLNWALTALAIDHQLTSPVSVLAVFCVDSTLWLYS